jgi:hypothetical protein
MQIIVTLRFHLTPVKMDNNKNNNNIGKDVKKKNLYVLVGM